MLSPGCTSALDLEPWPRTLATNSGPYTSSAQPHARTQNPEPRTPNPEPSIARLTDRVIAIATGAGSRMTFGVAQGIAIVAMIVLAQAATVTSIVDAQLRTPNPQPLAGTVQGQQSPGAPCSAGVWGVRNHACMTRCICKAAITHACKESRMYARLPYACCRLLLCVVSCRPQTHACFRIRSRPRAAVFNQEQRAGS